MKDFTFNEMFSGVGGFRLGLERNDWRCVWANDQNKYANKIYKKNFGSQELVEGDIREIPTKEIPESTLLTAGFPCQTFSVAGKRKGLKEARGTLFAHIVRVASHKRPPLLLLENVKGLLSSDNGRTFAIILRALAKLGYLLEWQVLNSKHFGVPQNRERVFIVGHLRGKGSRQIFPIGANGEVSSSKGEGEPESGEEASTLEASYGKSKSMNNLVLAGALSGGAHSGGLHSQMTTIPCLTPDRLNKRQHGRRFKKDGDPMFTLTGQDIHGIKIANTVCDGWLMDTRHHSKPMNQYRIRRLTPIECERLQGFPDGYTEGVSDTQRYKLLGNAVTVNVIEFLGEKLKECLER